ncbi:MAG TPA: hypothetical protein VHP63_01770 [candidate division Zixibacteria bacterium]|nr:hypothetical protein [candidate division Zixibacteria bacterium]
MKRIALLCSAGVFLLLAGQLLADIPKQMNYQGILSGSTGNPLADSTVDVEFRIYDAAAGGNSVWAETLSVTTDDEGRFNITLGQINPIEDTVFGVTERYLSINVESSGEISPRTKLTSVGYSNRVSTVDGASGGGIIGHTTIYGSGLDDLIALGVSDPNVALELRSGTTGGSPYIDFANDASTDFDARIQMNGEKGLKIIADTSFTVPLGKVGFGTLSPSTMPGLTNARVELADENGLLSDFTLRVAGTGGSSAQNFAKSRGTLNSPSIVSNGDLLGNILFIGHDGSDFGSPAAWIRAAVDGSPGINDMPGRLEFMTTPDGFESPLTRMTIKSDGNVGIGATTPTQKLHVAGNARVDDTLFASNVSSLSPLQLQTAGTTRMYVDDVTGNVGVGTTSPTAKLDVAGTVKIGTGGTPIGRVLRSTASLNFPGTGAGAESDLTMTVTGAVVGDAVFLGVPTSSVVSGGAYTAWVSAPSTVTIRFFSYLNAAGADPAIGTFQAVVMQF